MLGKGKATAADQPPVTTIPHLHSSHRPNWVWNLMQKKTFTITARAGYHLVPEAVYIFKSSSVFTLIFSQLIYLSLITSSSSTSSINHGIKISILSLQSHSFVRYRVGGVMIVLTLSSVSMVDVYSCVLLIEWTCVMVCWPHVTHSDAERHVHQVLWTYSRSKWAELSSGIDGS